MKRVLSIIGALLSMLFFVWLSLRGKDVGAIWEDIRHADLWWVCAYLLLLMVIHFIRAIRWGILLEPVVKVPFGELNMLAAVGFMLLVALPLRLGEFGRPFLVAEHMRVSKSASLASVVFERIVDGLTMGAMLVLLSWTLGSQLSPENAQYLNWGATLVSLGFGGGLVLLVFAAKLPAPTEALIRHSVGRIMPGIAERIITMLRSFTDGLRVLPSVGKAVAFFGLTAIYWTLAAFGLLLVAQAFPEPKLHALPWIAGYTMVGMQVIGAMIPGGPGAAGTFQWFTQFALGLFVGHSRQMDVVAAAYANTVWISQFAQQVLYGLLFVALGRIHPKALLLGLMSGKEPPEEPPSEPPAERAVHVA
jgi:uncharacterized protein (TIRG00374 family)